MNNKKELLNNLRVLKATKEDVAFIDSHRSSFEIELPYGARSTNATIYVAKNKNGIFGFVHISILPNGTARIETLATKNGFKRKFGIGNLLVGKAISHFHASKIKWPAKIKANSITAAGFFEKHPNIEKVASRDFRVHKRPL